MKVQSTMLEMFMVTDDNGEVIAGPFFFPQEAQEWIEGNSNGNE